MKFKNTLYVLILLFLMFAATAGADLKNTVLIDGHLAQAGRILIKPTTSANLTDLQAAIRAMDFSITRVSDKKGNRHSSSLTLDSVKNSSYLMVAIPENMDPSQAARLARSLPGVEEASPNYYRFLFYQPNDPNYEEKQINFSQIGMERVWNVTFGSDLIVAVLDTGYRSQGMSDSVENILPGYDFAEGDEDVTDYVGHGTIVANVIAEATDNGVACAGMAPDARILPVKVFPDEEEGAVDSDIIDGINYAVEQGAVVLNMSFGGGDDSPLMEQAMTDAKDAGAFLVAATGNDGEGELAIPSAYDSVFAVGSCGKHGFGVAPQKSNFSNYGQGLDIVAPGDNIVQEGYTADYGAGLYSASGTSVSAPHVSAAAALMIALGGPSDPDTLAQALRDSAVKGVLETKTGWDEELGYGELDVAGAIALYDEPLPNSPPVADASVFLETERVPANVTLNANDSTDPDGNILSYAWVLSDGTKKSSLRFEQEFLTPGTYTATVTVTDSEGKSDSDTVEFTVEKAAEREEDDGGGCGCDLSASPKKDIPGLIFLAVVFGWIFTVRFAGKE